MVAAKIQKKFDKFSRHFVPFRTTLIFLLSRGGLRSLCGGLVAESMWPVAESMCWVKTKLKLISAKTEASVWAWLSLAIL